MHRSPSRNSISTTGGTTTAKTLKHKPSIANVGRPRPSLGPPPKPATKDQTSAKKESHVDESFLARMMRPTQSSAKKASEKVPVSPPRKYSVPIKKLDAKDAEKNTKKTPAKIQASSTLAKTAKGTVKPVAANEQHVAKDTAPAAAQAETAKVVLQEAAAPSTRIAEVPVHKDEKVPAETIAESVSTIVAEEEEPSKDNIETVTTATDIGIPADKLSADESGVAEVQAVPEPALAAEVAEAELPVSVPAISADPLKQVDIEDTILEAQDSSHELHSTEPAAEGSKREDVGPQESITVSPEVPNVEGAVGEAPKEIKTGDEGKGTTGSTTEAEGIHISADSAQVEEVTMRDAQAATL